MNNPKLSPHIYMYLTMVFLILFTTSASWAEVSCGEVVGPKQFVTLTNDLDCFLPGAAIILDSNSILDLGGHTVDCHGGAFGVQMTGGGSRLKNGTITRCETGVSMEGGGGNIVSNVTAKYNGEGFHILTNNNELRNNKGFRNSSNGFFVENGNNNYLKDNIAKENELHGFLSQGHGNSLTGNRAIANRTEDGFFIDGNRNLVVKNLSKDQMFGIGFGLFGTGHQVISNRSMGNGAGGFLLAGGAQYILQNNTAKDNQDEGILVRSGVIRSTMAGNWAKNNEVLDLVDENPNCADNIWLGNNFDDGNQDCIQ